MVSSQQSAVSSQPVGARGVRSTGERGANEGNLLKPPSAFPALEGCWVVSVAGAVTSETALHAAIVAGMMPHTKDFVHALIEAVRRQQPIAPEIIEAEERVVRKAVDAGGEEHGTSGFKERVGWLLEQVVYLSCAKDTDPTRNGNSHVPWRSYELYDPRAYCDAQLTIRPNDRAILFGRGSILGADPTYVFEFGTSGRSLWDSMIPFLGKISSAPPGAWRDFAKIDLIEHESTHKGCYVATTADAVEVMLRPPVVR